MLLSDLEKKCNNPLILSNIQLHRKEPFVFYYRLITRGMVPVSLDCTWLTSENFASQVMSIKLIKCFGVAHRKPPDQAPADGCRGGGIHTGPLEAGRDGEVFGCTPSPFSAEGA